MKNILATFMFLMIVSVMFAQSVFNYNYPLAWNYNCFTTVYDNENYYLSGGIGFNDPLCDYWIIGHHITKISNLGIKDTTVVYGKCGQNVYSGYEQSMHKVADTLYVLGGEYNDSLCKLFFLSVNEGLDTIRNTYLLNDSTTKRAFSFCHDLDNNFLICGQIDSSYNEVLTPTPNITFTKPILIKIDNTGQILWSKSYSIGDISDGCWSSFYRVLPTYDKGFMAIGVTYDFGNLRGLVLKTDSLGNQQWVRFYGNPSFDNPGFSDIIATHDSCFIVCGSYTYGETFGGLYPYDGWMIKIDNNGNSMWNKKYRDYVVENTDSRDTIYNVFNGITELQDGRIAAVATSKNGTIYGRKPKLYIFNSTGDTIMTRLFEKPTYWYNPNSIVATDDGGFAIAGNGEFVEWNEETSSWESFQRIFLIKTDSLGNDTVLSNISPYQANPIIKFDLVCYPNPASNEFFVDLPQGVEDDVLEIYSTSGALVHEQAVGFGNNRIDVCNVKSGMYLVRLRGKGLFGKIVVE